MGAGSLLNSAKALLSKLHPNVISRSFRMAADKAVEVLEGMAFPVDLSDRDTMIKNAATSLNSKIISQNSSLLAPLAFDAVMKVTEPGSTHCDLTDIKVIKCFGGTVDDSEMVDGIVFPRKAAHFAGGPIRCENAKVGLIQFCISPPKTDMDSSVVVSDYAAMDRILREEKQYILKICKQIKAAGCNVLLIQKSILPDAVTADKLGSAAMCEEVAVGSGKVVKVTGIENAGRVATILLRASNKMLLDEAERSFHD